MKRRSKLFPVFALLLCLCLSACTDHLTGENFAKLKGGMTLEEVEAILGSGTALSESSARMEKAGLAGGKYEWRSGEKVVRVTFENGRLRKRARSGFKD